MRQADILLVEDDTNWKELSLRALNKAGFHRVTVARDGVEALSLLFGEGGPQGGEGSERIVLLDIKLPKIDGITVLQRIRGDERTKDLNVFALSSSEDPSELEECCKLGVLAVLPKPLDPETIKLYFPDKAA
ncbi:response regulator [Geomonas sp. Red276]